jgi:hypothetical protein
MPSLQLPPSEIFLQQISALGHAQGKLLDLLSDSGNRTYIITTRRITSGDELKYLNGLGGLARDLRLIPSANSPTPRLPR